LGITRSIANLPRSKQLSKINYIYDVETDEYFIDESGVEGMMFLKAKRPLARLFTIRIGYNSAAFGFGGLDGKLS
jgi:hypothetical protein